MLKYSLCFAIAFANTNIQTNDDHVAITCTGIAVTATCTFIASIAYAHTVVHNAQTQFRPERELLNYYTYYNGNYWTTDVQAALKRDLKDHIVHLHNQCRDQYSLSLLYANYKGEPTVFVDKEYALYPLLQHINDLSWYIKRLKIIKLLRLYSKRHELDLLIDQLEYIKHLMISDHDYNTEEQLHNH